MNIPSGLPKNLPDDLSDKLSENLPANLPDTLSEKLTDGFSDKPLESLPDTLSKTLLNSPPEGLPEDFAEDLSEDLPKNFSESLSENLYGGSSESFSVDCSEDIPDKQGDDFLDTVTHTDRDSFLGNSAQRTSSSEQPEQLVQFLFEAGMLAKTPRSGFQFLGSGGESVAEHSFRVSIIAYVLAHMAKLNPEKLVLLALFHDFHEARVGDLNYVNKRYVKVDSSLAMQDAIKNLAFAKDIFSFWDSFETPTSKEALLARDADQIDLLLVLREQLVLGNKAAQKWIDKVFARLRTEEGRLLGKKIQTAEPSDWWAKDEE